ncbi:hypothetical protein PR202_gb28426 [Eleusine coracana subsp. coracana]|uniref:F-box domain-containing protein n=1 Tax=Eleusine coracana subsp. coracana TaxID=191504 RepID=A0AAV5FXP0_ELECO|nr:hypothetical protein PR202_gb28426 [Eleusine coracana subsp. coracana]
MELSMADGQGDAEAPDAEPLPDELLSDREEGGEGELGGGTDGDVEEEEDVDGLASFLESEILSGSSADDPLDEEDEGENEKSRQVEVDVANNKRKQGLVPDGDGGNGGSEGEQNKRVRRAQAKGKAVAPQIDTGMFSNIPPELFLQIFKFLSSEDLISCTLVCRFMNAVASDETLWRRLYCMRWGLASNAKLRECAWKNLYIQVNDDKVILDKTVADQVSSWKSSRGLTDEAVKGHSCSGNTCSYTQIGDAYICEKTGRVHVITNLYSSGVFRISNKVVSLMKQSHSWDLDDLVVKFSLFEITMR